MPLYVVHNRLSFPFFAIVSMCLHTIPYRLKIAIQVEITDMAYCSSCLVVTAAAAAAARHIIKMAP